MTEEHGFDLPRLTDYLEEHVPDFRGPIRIEKFPQGQSNPTFLVESPSGSVVLRRKPPGVLLKSAHAVDREYRVLSALRATDVPVPEVLHLCSDDAVIGSWFYVMEYVEGRVFLDPTLPDLTPAQRGRVYDEANRVLAAIHSVDVDAVGVPDSSAVILRRRGLQMFAAALIWIATVAGLAKPEWVGEPSRRDSPLARPHRFEPMGCRVMGTQQPLWSPYSPR